MDSIYPPESLPYVSPLINLEEYFSQYSQFLAENFFKDDPKENEGSDEPQSTSKQIAHLMNIETSYCDELENRCSLSQLDGENESSTCQRFPEGIDSRWKRIPDNGSCFLATLVFQKGLLTKDTKKHVLKLAALRRTLLPNFAQPCVEQSVLKSTPQHLLLTIRIYSPFQHTWGEKIKPPTHTQDFLVLGSQNLCVLRDKIFCLNDSSVVGEVGSSGNAAQVSIKELIPSGMFFFGNTFYCDFRDPLSKDYGEWIENWVKEKPERNLGPFQHKSMEETTFEDLEIRLGLPYVFIHLGNCEHLVSFIDARLMTSEDPQDVNSYPLIEEHKPKHQFCVCCTLYPSKWIVEGSERLPHSPAFLCDNCFQSFHFKDGEKIGSFQYYPYPSLPIQPAD